MLLKFNPDNLNGLSRKGRITRKNTPSVILTSGVCMRCPLFAKSVGGFSRSNTLLVNQSVKAAWPCLHWSITLRRVRCTRTVLFESADQWIARIVARVRKASGGWPCRTGVGQRTTTHSLELNLEARVYVVQQAFRREAPTSMATRLAAFHLVRLEI